MRIKKVIIGLIVGASLIAGQATVGAWNGNTAASPETYECTRINTTPGNLGGFRGRANGALVLGGRVQSYTTCTTVSALYD